MKPVRRSSPGCVRSAIGGHITHAHLLNIFLDALALDIERAQRVNATLALIPREVRARSNLRPL